MKKQKHLDKLTPRLAEIESGAPEENYESYSYGGDEGFDQDGADFDPGFAEVTEEMTYNWLQNLCRTRICWVIL